MEGTVKRLGDRGYGFIVPTSGGPDLYFNFRDYGSQEPLRPWCRVRFELGRARDGRPVATCVRFVAYAQRPVHSKPYYGKKTSTKRIEKTNALGAAVLGGLILGPAGILIGAVAAACSGNEPRMITSDCLRCGGTGHVTSITEQRIGFQCQRCRNHWTKYNKDGISAEDVDQQSV